jgi:hypothetical protein
MRTHAVGGAACPTTARRPSCSLRQFGVPCSLHRGARSKERWRKVRASKPTGPLIAASSRLAMGPMVAEQGTSGGNRGLPGAADQTNGQYRTHQGKMADRCSSVPGSAPGAPLLAGRAVETGGRPMRAARRESLKSANCSSFRERSGSDGIRGARGRRPRYRVAAGRRRRGRAAVSALTARRPDDQF